MLSKDLYSKMKQLHKETGIGLMIARHILEKHNNNYEDAVAYIKSAKSGSLRSK